MPNLVIRWQESGLHRYDWFVRGLRSNGTYFGEVRLTFDEPRVSDNVFGVGRSIEGTLTTVDIQRLMDRVARIRAKPYPETDMPVTGVLAEGPIGEPNVLYRHPNPKDSIIADSFLEIIAILRPYLTQHYPSLH